MSSDAEVVRVSEHLAIAQNNELITEMEKRSMTSVLQVFDTDQPLRLLFRLKSTGTDLLL